MLKKFQPIDIIAILTIAGGLVLKFFNIDGTVGTILTTIVLFYFGKREIVDKIREKKFPGAKAEAVEEIVKRVAAAEGVDPDLALRVARCESGLNPAAKNTNANGSIDRGLFQWNNKWHPEITDEIAYDAEKATWAFCKAVNKGFIGWWDASKKCWKV